MSDKLLPCPFCGSSAGRIPPNRVYCQGNNGCPIISISFTPEEWNRRTPSPRIGALELAVEVVAAECHRQWAGWTQYLLRKMKAVPPQADMLLERVWHDRWQKQIFTKYEDLREDEKESDRVEARKILAALDKLEAE